MNKDQKGEAMGQVIRIDEARIKVTWPRKIGQVFKVYSPDRGGIRDEQETQVFRGHLKDHLGEMIRGTVECSPSALMGQIEVMG